MTFGLRISWQEMDCFLNSCFSMMVNILSLNRTENRVFQAALEKLAELFLWVSCIAGKTEVNLDYEIMGTLRLSSLYHYETD